MLIERKHFGVYAGRDFYRDMAMSIQFGCLARRPGVVGGVKWRLRIGASWNWPNIRWVRDFSFYYIPKYRDGMTDQGGWP